MERQTQRPGRPASITAIFLIFVVAGGGLEGYAVALAAGTDTGGRSYSLVWALLGAALVVTGWALRGRRWWGAAAAIAVAVVGLFVGMYGVNAVLVIASGRAGAAGDGGGWMSAIALVAVGAAAIAMIGLLSSAWGWLTATSVGRLDGAQPADPA